MSWLIIQENDTPDEFGGYHEVIAVADTEQEGWDLVTRLDPDGHDELGVVEFIRATKRPKADPTIQRP